MGNPVLVWYRVKVNVIDFSDRFYNPDSFDWFAGAAFSRDGRHLSAEKIAAERRSHMQILEKYRLIKCHRQSPAKMAPRLARDLTCPSVFKRERFKKQATGQNQLSMAFIHPAR
jgi:hypothetical protein